MTIRVGVVGTGFGAKVHAPVLKSHTDYELVAMASQRPGRAKQAASQLQIPLFYDNWERMLEQAPIDLVVLATRPADHKEMATRALSAGLHVLCEKPPALNVSETETMRNVANAVDRVAAMNFEWRYLPERRALEEILQAGRIGQILHVSWSEAWPMWGQIQKFEAGWDWQAEEGGGMLGAVGSHIIDALCHWFGDFELVKGITMNHVPRRPSAGTWIPTSAEDSFSFTGILHNRITCAVSCTVARIGSPLRVEIFGTEGALRLNAHDLLIATTDSPEFRPVPVTVSEDPPVMSQDIQGYVVSQRALYTDLAKAIAGYQVPELPDFADAYLVQSVMHRLQS